VVLYVGEWRGNTGTRQFEEKLLSDWELVERTPLPGWGAEANALMVWRRTGHPTPEIRCMQCLQPAKRRCRVCREHAFCSAECMAHGEADHARAHVLKGMPGGMVWSSKHFDWLKELTELASTIQ